ncbi:MAG: nuclear transport factor 2 family protein [Gammaproteobacteria bacterium]|nr:nuclear transport factor 2 family protein [Gammaproteobacteria bacterium]
MNKQETKFSTILSLLLICQFSYSQNTIKESYTSKYEPINKEIYDIILAKDKEYFDAYNTCDMKKQESFYSEKLEFFHDKGGLSTSKQDVLASIEKNICGKVTRTRIEASIEVYPIKDYGAVEIGYHKFYNNQEPNAESKPVKFILVWKKEEDKWLISKVISLH